MASLKGALKDANIPTLLMVYTTYSHDRAYLDRFAPHLRGIYTAEGPSDVPEDLADDLREKLFALLTSPTPPVEKPIEADLLRHMMGVSVGEEVPEDQVPVLYDQMGFERAVPRKDIPGRKDPAGFKVLVIGGGMTGIAAGVKLAEAGYDYTIIEKNPQLGGTWLENRYPGVGLDTPSHFYSYSFELNPDWSTYHPKGAEIQDYLLSVADKYGIRGHVQFETKVVECRWDDAKSIWHITLEKADGTRKVEDANAVLLAHGVLNRWSMPNIPGLDRFKGPKMHSAGWDPSVDVTGKRVALIGTGASAAQLGPAISDKVKSLTVFQRSRHWVLNNPDINVHVNDNIRFALKHIPHYKEWFRFRVYWFTGDGLYGNVKMDENHPTPDISISAQNHAVRDYALWYIHEKLKDRPDLLGKMIPDYPIFGKRIVLDADGGWLDMLLKPNVTLDTDGIDHIEENAVVTKGGKRYEVDILALATGFDLAPPLGPLQVFGRGGCDLQAAWGHDEARSYLGIMAPAYPNFFMTLGPNSAPNHAAGVNMVLEAQIHYIIEALDKVVAAGGKAIEPTVDAYLAWNRKVEDQMKHMIWSHPKAKSYYLSSTGRNYVSCPFRLSEYWSWTRRPDEEALVIS
ncbi:flavin-containing monooxygenase [Novosphingobium sp. KACC 22771]|uniref:flavin-containing monooxygenase n=1 Tax=Novosphingobium sp. KACC 22771 TaxID=3025670 RepID=UPI002364FD93|nr:NAD(P)/FAD-dependent oxidoreductase [Novosphingobium sp. KACC 22771]WDF74343.1 NAD(P)/FAD-dependent oxidoreductase [Novosphingobium sp. KACC 22771]